MKQTNARAVLYGRSNRLREVQAENIAADEGDVRVTARSTQRRTEKDAPKGPAYAPGRLQAAD
jgi:hypothetical protein